jgi:hypothetical protein
MSEKNTVDKIIRLKTVDIVLDLMEKNQSLPDFDQQLELEELSLWLVENGLGEIEQELRQRLQHYVDKNLSEFDQPIDLERFFEYDQS